MMSVTSTLKSFAGSELDPEKLLILKQHSVVYTGSLSHSTPECEQDQLEFTPHDWPKEKVFRTFFDKFIPKKFPLSYQINSPKELRMLKYVENFRVQYCNLYPDRKPLLLKPYNECDIPKFVCSTIIPTKLQHPELYDWDGIANFVKDFINYVPLIPATELPRRLLSPTTVLYYQKGTIFDYSTLLVSLLIGVGYDAYVVSGYADREVCYLDEKMIECPYLESISTIEEAKENIKPKKYSIKPTKDYRSKFELYLEAREIERQRQDEQEKEEQHNEEVKRAEKPPPDKWFGLRIHSWVLVLEGKRDIQKSFFIEPTTGNSHPLVDYPCYNGIESVWNTENYWVNMQDCSKGIRDMNYNLNNEKTWEHMIPRESEDNYYIKCQLMKSVENELVYEDDDQEEILRMKRLKEEHAIASKRPELPPSWVKPLEIVRERLETSYPLCQKVNHFKRVVVERFANYYLPDGLVMRLHIYSDIEYQALLRVEEYFNHRTDHLYKKVLDCTTGWVTEYFYDGRLYMMKQHTYKESAPGPESERYILFENKIRVDGLYKREETATQLTDYFIGRPDRLIYRQAIFLPRSVLCPGSFKVRSFSYIQESKEIKEPIEGKEPSKELTSEQSKITTITVGSSQENVNAHEKLNINLTLGKPNQNLPKDPKPSVFDHRIIDKIIERFERDPSKKADDDIAERVFFISENKIKLTYHITAGCVSQSTREYIKPQQPDDNRSLMTLADETHSCFNVNQYAKPWKQKPIYQLLLDLLKAENISKEAIRWAENETRNILELRDLEMDNAQLYVSLFDSLRNEDAKTKRLEMEKLIQDEALHYQQLSVDYLAPFLAKIGFPEHLTWAQTCRLREDCLDDFKNRLINKARLIQKRICVETNTLQERQQRYMENRCELSEEDEVNYLEMCGKSTFLITTLRVMLNRHRQAAPYRYIELEDRIQGDHRLMLLQKEPLQFSEEILDLM